MILRALIAIVLIYCAAKRLWEVSTLAAVPELLAAGLAVFILAGLWTPVICTLTGLVEVWVVLTRTIDPLIPIILGILSACLAMIGPGAWSVDARIFGRKRIQTTEL